MPNEFRFAGYPAAVILDAPDGKPVQQLLWGDYATELARSAPETIKHPAIVREQFREAARKLEEATTPEAREKARAKYEDLLKTLERSVAVYGAVNLRTDGHRIVMGYKIEKPRTKDNEWDLYLLEPTAGVLRFVSKYQEKA